MVVESLLPYVEREVKKFQPKLARYGSTLAKKVVLRLQGLSPILVVDPNFKPPPPDEPFGPKWLPRVTDPILNAVTDGFKTELQPYTQKLTKKLATRAAVVAIPVVLGLVFAGFLVGRYTKK